MGEGTFLITFKPADIEAAHDPDQMFSHAKLNKRLGMLSVNDVDTFIDCGEYHKARGDFVFQRVQDTHESCREVLKHYVKEEDILSSIPISNSFLVKAKSSQIRGLVNV